MNLLDTNYNFFGSRKYLKMINNSDWTFKLLPSKNDINSHKGFLEGIFNIVGIIYEKI